MPSHPYLSEEEITLLNELFQEDSPHAYLTLSLLLEKEVAPLIEQASHLELKLTLGDKLLSFPVLLSPANPHQEQALLTAPHIMSTGGHPRAWRLPTPQHIQLKQLNGKQLAVEIRDLSINGMRLLSRRSLFNQARIKQAPLKQTLLLVLAEETVKCEVTLVREHKSAAFWLAAVTFKLNAGDKQALLDFVFRGFLAHIEKKQAP